VAGARGSLLPAVLLDNAAGELWYRRVTKRPAYRHADAELLERATALGEAAISGTADLVELNKRSLAFRRKS
jgi:hypothetical protein